MKKCRYNSKTDPLCPIFKLEDITAACGDDFSKVAFKVSYFGISITSSFQCRSVSNDTTRQGGYSVI